MGSQFLVICYSNGCLAVMLELTATLRVSHL